MTDGPGRSPSAARTPAGPLRDFVEELVRAGLREAVVCPGSRSTPLALALRAHPGVRVLVLLDERAAAFFALGMARSSGRAVAVLATSGTAAVNFGPAVVEAFYGRVPLLVLTADRPAELQDRGAPQTIDQTGLYGRHVKWAVQLPVPDESRELSAHLRSVAGRALAVADSAPRGPVHLNLPFREPLVPDGDLGPRTDRARVEASIGAVEGGRALTPAQIERLADVVRGTERGLIVAGPHDDPALPAAMARLAASTGFPILADPLSGVRLGPHDRRLVIARGDLLTRPGPWLDAHRPELVIRFGAMPTSKPILQLLQTVRPVQIVVDEATGWREAALIPTTFVHADPSRLAEDLAEALGRADPDGRGRTARWTADWLEAEAAASVAIERRLAGLDARDEPFEGLPFACLPGLLSDGSIVWAGSSMPVRDLDAYLPGGPKSIRCLANRGANGIDGVVSSALGAAAVNGGPVVLVVGDLSFLHDLNALVAARLHGLSATIVLINNDGGGIFSFLPQATTEAPGAGLPEHYEELFGTPHGVDFGPIVRALGGEHQPVQAGSLGEAIARSIETPGVQVLELRTERRRNVALHREAAAAVAEALSRLTASRDRVPLVAATAVDVDE